MTKYVHFWQRELYIQFQSFFIKTVFNFLGGINPHNSPFLPPHLLCLEAPPGVLTDIS